MNMDVVGKEEDFLDNIFYFHQEQETQSDINILRKNLTETSIYTQLFNNFNFKKVMEKIEKEDYKKENKKKILSIEDEEQINEVKYNMFMILYNECEYPEEDRTKFVDFFDNIKTILVRKLIIQDCEVCDTKLLENKKEYVFIPITEEIKFHYNNQIITLIKGKKKDKIPNKMLIKDKKDEKKEIVVINESELKDKYGNEFKNEIINLKNHSYNSAKSSEYSVKTDNSDNEINGERFYAFMNDKRVKRFIFNNSYKKPIDGFFSRHKKINLGIEGEVNTFDYSLNNYNIKNDLKAHIIFKNFIGDSIAEKEPIILEIKKSFKIYDLLNQIKQISKIAKNLIDKNGENNINFPKYIIGIMCNNYEGDAKRNNTMKLKEFYKKTNITLLQHDLDVINKNGVKVVICAIKDEKIMGYDLSQPDFDIKGESAKYRVDLEYLCKKIFPNENKTSQINIILKNYKDIYESLTLDKISSTFQYDKKYKNVKDENKQLKIQIQSLKAELKKKDERNSDVMTEFKKEKKEHEKNIIEVTSEKGVAEIINELMRRNRELEAELKKEKEKNATIIEVTKQSDEKSKKLHDNNTINENSGNKNG